MPMFDFRCAECDYRFDDIVRYEDRAVVRCPICGGATQVLVSAPAVRTGVGAAIPSSGSAGSAGGGCFT